MKLIYATILIASISLVGFFAVMQGFSSTQSTESTDGLNALNSYIYITGDVQGDILGSVTQAGREDSIVIYQFSQSFQTGGKGTTHTPLYMTKPIDKSSPLLFQAMNTNENLYVQLLLWKPDQTGKEVQYYTIELLDAKINSIHYYQKDNKNPDLMAYEHSEEISFTYQQIIFEDVQSGNTAQGQWQGTVV